MPTKMSHASYQDDHHHHYHDRNHSHHQLAVKQEAQAFTTTTTTTKEQSHNVFGRKFNRDSYIIKKSPTRSLVGCPPASNKSQNHLQQERGPVIIYTHSPKIIHTNARDFRALVQKLTGMSKAKEAAPSSMARDAESRNGVGALLVANEGPRLGQLHLLEREMGKCLENGASNKNNSTDELSSSVIADENSSSGSTTTGDAIGQVNPCVGPPLFDPPPGPPNLPFFMDSSSELLYCSGGGDPSIYEYMDFNVSYNHVN